ncbi:MAG: DUF3641 domain-containing protein [Planctomycetes bacterium]|nr:DUF3641 domain-containing protein [Nannocystis sp.]MBA3547009.1 DUF3641 domain-containing protein [Nannocystis sp.]MBA3845018.1 DUF3641 domain-containing protein [Planctomycetota bacterium]
MTRREKALIGLAVAHAVRCPYCIDAYTTGRLEQGCSRTEQMEAVHVAAAITGGAALVHGVQMRKRAQQLAMTLMSNPAGAFLPPPQAAAEARFKDLLRERHGVVFDDLVELTNMPISRSLEFLLGSGAYVEYMRKLSGAFNPAAVEGLMCRSTLSVGWDGRLYDCDFNQMLELPVASAARTISDYRDGLLEGRPIVVGVQVAQHELSTYDALLDRTVNLEIPA